MSRKISLRGLAAAVGFAGIAAACSDQFADLIGPSASRGDRFNSYVAIGNSITAGYQSGGLTEATQRASYPALLAQAMGTRMALPILTAPGCPPPITNFQTQARTPASATSTTCFLRSSSGANEVINNVGVPGATSFDPTSSSTTASNALTTFILGGLTQVEKAMLANPTFVSIWIGNNDVLGPAISLGGTSSIGPSSSLNLLTPQTTFQANVAATVDQLRAQNGNLSGVLVGVVNVSNAPIMFPAAAMSSPAFKGGFDAIACGAATSGCFGAATVLHPSCTTSPGNTSIINTFLAFQIRLGAHPAVVACQPGAVPGTAVGDAFVLDATEQGTITTAVNGYNAYLQAKADSVGFAFLNPNPILAGLKSDTTGSLVRVNVNWGSATIPFGTGMSLDGVHPANSLHVRIANELIAVINTKYSTTLPNVQ
jgi:hypothetical protein